MVFYIKLVIFRRYVPQEAGNLGKIVVKQIVISLKSSKGGQLVSLRDAECSNLM